MRTYPPPFRILTVSALRFQSYLPCAFLQMPFQPLRHFLFRRGLQVLLSVTTFKNLTILNISSGFGFCQESFVTFRFLKYFRNTRNFPAVFRERTGPFSRLRRKYVHTFNTICQRPPDISPVFITDHNGLLFF